MITTLFFIHLIAFQIWYVTSKQVKHSAPSTYLLNILRHKQAYRIAALGLMLLVTVLFVIRLGWMSGICASIAGLMGVGCLVVILNPFRYVNGKAVVLLYAFFFVLEFFV